MLTVYRTVARELLLAAAGLALIAIGVVMVVKADELSSWKAVVMVDTPVGGLLLASHIVFASEQECRAFLKSKDFKAMTDNAIKHITDAGVRAKAIAVVCTDKVAPPPPKGEAI